MYLTNAMIRTLPLRASRSRLFTQSASRLLFKPQNRDRSKIPLTLINPTEPINQEIQVLNLDNTKDVVAGKAGKDTEKKDPTYDAKYDNHKILKRIPKFLRPYTTQFIYAPVSHVTAFVILHELTAIVPLVGIWYALHEYHDVLMATTLDLPTWALEKGTQVMDKVLKDWDFGSYSLHDKMKFISEGAYAYVIVKALFPVRLAVSILGMPFFAKWFVLPFTRLFSRAKKNPNPEVPQSPLEKHSAKKVEQPRL